MAAGQDWVDYGDEEDADETNAASWKRELAEVSPGSGAAAGYGMAGGYGSNSGRTSPYGVSPMGPGILSPPPVGVLSPPPPPQVSVYIVLESVDHRFARFLSFLNTRNKCARRPL